MFYKNKKELLYNLEKSNNYLFHGSPNKIEVFEPKQAYTFINGQNIKDDDPAIHASPIIDIAIFMSLINRINCPKGSYSKFEYKNNKVVFEATKETLEQLNKPKGYIYVFERSFFKQRDYIEYVTYKSIIYNMVIKVGIDELPQNIELISFAS
ncbi:MAG: hypothetical protein AABZ74_08885 [Cyanobacteriota bacterium]